MTKLTREGLERLREELRSGRRTGVATTRARLTVHLGTCGFASGAGKVLDAARQALEELAPDAVELATTGCAGLCCREPMATVEREGERPVKYADLDAAAIVDVVREHVLGGQVVEKYALAVGEETVA
jgi:NADP-reducing hydrogenase subunit HndB